MQVLHLVRQHSRQDIPPVADFVAEEIDTVNDIELKNVLSEIESLEIQENLFDLTDKICLQILTNFMYREIIELSQSQKHH